MIHCFLLRTPIRFLSSNEPDTLRKEACCCPEFKESVGHPYHLISSIHGMQYIVHDLV